VKLTANGFVPFTQQVELTERETRGAIDAVLERPTASSYGVVNVRTVPAAARVLFDGTDTGDRTPATISEIEPGVEHTLALSLDGYVTRTETLTLQAGQVEDLSFELERLPLSPREAILRLVTVPANARVQFDGEWHDTGSPYEFRVEAKAYSLRVARTGHRSDEQRVTLPGGEVTELAVRLRATRPSGGGMGMAMAPPDMGGGDGPGQLTFDARPWCNVTINGRAAGQTPIVNRSLPSGTHRITCTNPDLGASQTITVDIRPGETTRRRLSLQ
jgi:hypothetical protein